ncbi:hypothetical protein GCM10009824_11140 [Kocuria atrinae]|uniref:Rifampin ADP-ribosyltransferase domain-containing protein n=1 Tax=Kocuria atrinae TaxID=592377 RepID=A0ABP5J9P9_9MICC
MPGRIYIVEPTGAIEDDPHVTDKRFPGNPTRSYRSLGAVRILSELRNWTGHTADQLQTMMGGLAGLRARCKNTIIDERPRGVATQTECGVRNKRV